MNNIWHFDIEPANLWKRRNTRVVRMARNNGEIIDSEGRRQKSHLGDRWTTTGSQNTPHNSLFFKGIRK
jgi:hypothetical protein